MKLALIPPNCSHDSILDGTINLILPIQLKTLPTDFVQQVLTSYTILDNGAAEGVTTGLNELDNLLGRMEFDYGRPADELVLPDVLTDCETTRTFVLEVKNLDPLLYWRTKGVKFMAVAQGKTLAEIMSCINLYTELDYVDVIGLPRVMNQQFQRFSRLRMCESLAKTDSYHKPIHCLGSYYFFPSEVRDLKWLPNVRSMDTSLPWVYGIQGRYVSAPPPRNEIARPENYFNFQLNGQQRYVSERNITTLLRWAKAPRG